MSPRNQRLARLAQQKHRGGKTSPVTDLENTLLLLAWEAELLSCGQVVELLGSDIVSVRKLREDMLDRAMRLAESLSPRKPPPARGNDDAPSQINLTEPGPSSTGDDKGVRHG